MVAVAVAFDIILPGFVYQSDRQPVNIAGDLRVILTQKMQLRGHFLPAGPQG